MFSFFEIKSQQHSQEKRRGKNPPLDVKHYYLSSRVLKLSHEYLKKEGMAQKEGYVIWGGWYPTSESCVVTTCIIPRGISRYGGVKIPLEEILRLSRKVRELDLFIVAQLHTHPGNFGHSKGDEVNAISFRKGFLSIVVPNFARSDNFDIISCFVHVYQKQFQWKLLKNSEIKQKFIIDPDILI